MKTKLLLALFLLAFSGTVTAQRNCSSYDYLKQLLATDPSLRSKIEAIENFSNSRPGFDSRIEQETVITIPVVVHVLYHQPGENISDAQIFSQLEALNRCFRRKNPDSIRTPDRFRPVAADCGIEFKLAISDPHRKNTTGIVRKYTPISLWEANDKMKFSAEMGDDAWDAKNYLNIWVCNIGRVMGYSSVTGGAMEKDGIVIGYNVFGTINTSTGFSGGKTAVHETGHWLNLKHLWGDDFCGDDGIYDTPKQAGYNVECPSGIRLTCGNGPNGDMYMNYMDFTNDDCMNLFTVGQKERMRAMFATGGLRNSILSSKGLDLPLINESPLPTDDPKWLHPQLFPNPATHEMTLDLAYDVRWIGKILYIFNLQGQIVLQVQVSSKNQKINISKLQPGMYILQSKKDDGESLKLKFIKL
jgi:hypothetical protein